MFQIPTAGTRESQRQLLLRTKFSVPLLSGLSPYGVGALLQPCCPCGWGLRLYLQDPWNGGQVMGKKSEGVCLNLGPAQSGVAQGMCSWFQLCHLHGEGALRPQPTPAEAAMLPWCGVAARALKSSLCCPQVSKASQFLLF